MMITAGAVIWTVLATSAIGLAWNACSVSKVYAIRNVIFLQFMSIIKTYFQSTPQDIVGGKYPSPPPAHDQAHMLNNSFDPDRCTFHMLHGMVCILLAHCSF